MKSKLAVEMSALVLREIRENYLEGKIIRTDDCIDDMAREGWLEADVEKVIIEATKIEKVMPAKSKRASNAMNTHYVIHGESITCEQIYCKICSNYHPVTNEFICWKLTSFCKNV